MTKAESSAIPADTRRLETPVIKTAPVCIGIGLGLAIVKTCIDACQGTVSARNRETRGLEVSFNLKRGS